MTSALAAAARWRRGVWGECVVEHDGEGEVGSSDDEDGDEDEDEEETEEGSGGKRRVLILSVLGLPI